MKEKALLAFLVLIVAVSVFFTYQRSFVWQNFDLINSEEEVEGEGLEEEESAEEGDALTEEDPADVSPSGEILPQ